VRRFTFVMLMSTTLVAMGTWFGARPSAQSNRALEASMTHFNVNRQVHGLSVPPDGASAVYSTYRVTLVVLDPAPTANRVIRPSEYVATLVVSRA
jgi:hypothetical protein